MTVRDVLWAVLRRWYVLVAVLVCAALLTVALARDGGSYTTRTVISFLAPAKTSLAQGNGLDDASVIAFAGAVAKEINNGRAPATYSETDAPFYGAGVREGVLIALSNFGNQWVNAFLRAEIEIQIVGRTPEWVAAKQRELIDRVMEIADAQQSGAGTSSEIQAEVVPLTMKIDHVSASRSAQLAAAAAMGLAALIVGTSLAVLLDSRVRGHRIKSRTRGFAGPRHPRVQET